MRGAHIEAVAVLSTAHLPQHEARTIEALINENVLIGMKRDEGFMLFNRQTNQLEDYSLDNLHFLLNLAQQESVDWLMFDRDGPELPAVKTWQW